MKIGYKKSLEIANRADEIITEKLWQHKAALNALTVLRSYIDETKELKGESLKEINSLFVSAENAFSLGAYVDTLNYTKYATERLTAIKYNIEDAKSNLTNALNLMTYCKKNQIYIILFEETYKQAFNLFNAGNYDNAAERARSVLKTLNTVINNFNEAKKQISYVEKQINDCKNLSINVKSVDELYNQANNMLKIGKYAEVSKCINSAQLFLKNIMQNFEEAKKQISTLESILNESKDVNIGNTNVKTLYEQGKKSFGLGDYTESAKDTRMAIEILNRIKLNFEDAMKQLSLVKTLVNDFNKNKIITSPVEKLIQQAEDEFNQGRYGDSTAHSKSILDSLKYIRHDYEEANKRISDAETLKNQLTANSIDITPIEQVYLSVKKSFLEGNYKESIGLSEKLVESLKKLRESGKPDCIMSILTTDLLKKDMWNKFAFKVENYGSVDAKNIVITFPNDLETRKLQIIPYLKVNEEKNLEIAVKPKEMGNIPIDITISCERPFDRNVIHAKSTIWLNVERQIRETTPETKVAPLRDNDNQTSIPATNVVFICKKCHSRYVEGGKCPFCK